MRAFAVRRKAIPHGPATKISRARAYGEDVRTFPRDGKRPKLTFKKEGGSVLARQGKRIVRLPLAQDAGIRIGKHFWNVSVVVGRGHNIKRVSWDETTAESLAVGAARTVLQKHRLDRSGHRTLENLVDAWDAAQFWEGLLRDWQQKVVINQVLS